MTEQDTFETRLATALRAFADEVPVDVDPVTLTQTVSSARSGHGGRGFVSRPVWFAGAAAVVVLAVIGLALPLGRPGPDGASVTSPTPSSTAAPSTTGSPSRPPSQTPSPTPPSASPSRTMELQVRDGYRRITGGSRDYFSIQVPAHWTDVDQRGGPDFIHARIGSAGVSVRQPSSHEYDWDAFVDRMARSEFSPSAVIHRGQHGSHQAVRITERTGGPDRLRGKVIYLVSQPHSVHWIVEIGWDTEELGPVIDEILSTFNPDGRDARIVAPVP